MKKIALEEHFLFPEFEDYWATTVGSLDPGGYEQIRSWLTDFDGRRLEAMDAAGIAVSVLSLTCPGVQIERDTAVACRRASRANDLLAAEVQKRPDRYSGFAHLPMQDARAAADELERCVRQLGFCGALINGHTNGRYLDERSYDPFWERVQGLGVPVYLHPGDPVSTFPAIAGCDGLKRAMWEWGVETGSHAMRLVLGGVFDRYPNVRVVLGHMGETLPYLLWRFDSRAGLYGLKLSRRPSEYIRENFLVTCSGMFSDEPLICAIQALGADRVMFSVDYPYESPAEAKRFIERAAITDDVRAAICHATAERLLQLNGAVAG